MGGFFHHYKDQAGQWRWRYLAGNQKIIAVSSEAYVAKADCLRSIEIMQKEAPSASVGGD